MSPSRRRFVVGAIAVVSMVASGCGPDDQTAPRPTSPLTTPATTTTTTTTTTSSEPPRPTVAPPITRTLDIAPYRTRPCELLTRDQQVALGLPPQSGSEAIDCEWKMTEPTRTVSVAPFVKEDFFNNAYRESNDGAYPGATHKRWTIFEPLTVAGQPAVVVSYASDRFNCGVIVGTGLKSSFWVVVIDADKTVDSCPRAVAVAEQIIHRIEH